jgi:hypothetical protein
MSKFDAAIYALNRFSRKSFGYSEDETAQFHNAIRVLEYAPKVADGLDNAERVGAEKDEPEGSRWIQMSDTLAKIIARGLRGEDKDE